MVPQVPQFPWFFVHDPIESTVAETEHHLLYLQTSFFIDWDPPSVGLLKNGSRSEPKGDFAIALKALVEAGANTGYLAVVKRAVDGKTK